MGMNRDFWRGTGPSDRSKKIPHEDTARRSRNQKDAEVETPRMTNDKATNDKGITNVVRHVPKSSKKTTKPNDSTKDLKDLKETDSSPGTGGVLLCLVFMVGGLFHVQ